MNSMEKHRKLSEWTRGIAVGGLSLCVAALVSVTLSSCGKKNEETKTAPAPEAVKPVAPEPPKQAQPPVPVEKPKAPPAPAPAPVVAPKAASEPAHTSPDSAAQQRWDKSAASLRNIGLTVRPSADPSHMEIVDSNGRMGATEARLLVKNVYQNLGGGQLFVTLFNQAGMPLAEATANGVR